MLIIEWAPGYYLKTEDNEPIKLSACEGVGINLPKSDLMFSGLLSLEKTQQVRNLYESTRR